MSNFVLEIITPQRVVFADEVNSVSTPTPQGIITVLPKHTLLFTKLVEGELRILKGSEEIFLAIGGGFMEVNDKKASILVTAAYKADEINEKEVLQAKERAEKVIKEGGEKDQLIQAQRIFQRSNIALKVAKRHKVRKRLSNN